MSACVVCRLERFNRYLGRREGEDGGEGGRQEAALVSSLSSLANGDGGGRPTPFPPLPIGAIIHIILANQKTSKLHHRWMLELMGIQQAPSFQFKDWVGCFFGVAGFASFRVSKAV